MARRCQAPKVAPMDKPDIYDAIQAAMRGEGKVHAPIGALVGFDIAAIGPGRATVVIDADERLANPLGTMHGGAMCDIADAAMGLAYVSTLERGETFTTLELKINFMKP